MIQHGLNIEITGYSTTANSILNEFLLASHCSNKAELAEYYRSLHEKLDEFEPSQLINSDDFYDDVKEQLEKSIQSKKSKLKPKSRNSLNNVCVIKNVKFIDNFDNSDACLNQPVKFKFCSSTSLPNRILEVSNESEDTTLSEIIDSSEQEKYEIDYEALETLESAEDLRQELVFKDNNDFNSRGIKGIIGSLLSYLNPFNCICKN